MSAITHDPQQIQGRHIEHHLPAGPAAPHLRQLMSEIEMWLFEHPVNQTRSAYAAPAVSALWLWGCADVVSSLPPVDGWAAGDDPFFRAFGAQPDSPRPGSGVAVIGVAPGAAEWGDIESRWLEPSIADLRSGRIARLELSAADRKYIVSTRWRRRFWRRPRPWWECFA